MRLYLVECQVLCGDNGRFLIKANNKKEALNKIWEEHYVPKNKELEENGYNLYFKKDLYVRDVEKELFQKNDTYIRVW